MKEDSAQKAGSSKKKKVRIQIEQDDSQKTMMINTMGGPKKKGA